MELEIRLTDDGSSTLYNRQVGEHYHSTHGAVTESMHVFIREGLEKTYANPLSLLEVGFGTGLNALLTWQHAKQTRRKVMYDTVEKYPLDPGVISLLNYPDFLAKETGEMFRLIHRAKWEEDAEMDEWFTLRKIRSDILTVPVKGKFDLVYFDAFSPGKQPEMWSEEIFRKLFDCMKGNALLTTYAASGRVKRVLKECGFLVESVAGPAGKREMTRATRP